LLRSPAFGASTERSALSLSGGIAARLKELWQTFVDSGVAVAAALEVINHQVLYRR